MLQLNITHWQAMVINAPWQTVAMSMQRIAITELATYCPTLRLVQFWHGHSKVLWRYENDHWVNVFTNERPQDTYWRNF